MWNSTNGESGAAVNGNAGVYATNSSNVTVFAGVTVDCDNGNLQEYTTTEINVTDGKLRLGVKNNGTMGARWFGVDWIKLTLVAAPDLADYVEAYNTAKTNAKDIDQTQTMAPSILTALQTAISNYETVDETSISALETATEALNTATAKAQTSIKSYQIIATASIPDNSLEGWTCENTNTFHINTWSTEGNSDGSNMKTPFIENWVGKGSFLGAGKVYYRLEGLEPGEVYRVEALVRSYNEASADAPNGPNFYVNGDVADLTEVGTTFTYNGMSGIYGTQVAAATIGADGILELGVVIADNRNYNWVAFKSVKISTFDAAYEAAKARIEALNGKIPAAAYTAASSTIPATKPTTANDFISAIDAMATAAASAETMVEPYAAYNELKAYADALVAVAPDNAIANSTLATAISTAETDVNNAADAAAIANATATLKTAMVTYAGAANPVGDGAQFDLTFMLTNPDVTEYWDGTWGIQPAGWFNDQEGGNFQVMGNEEMGPGGEVFMEYWSENPRTSGFVLYQKATLPEGTYKMTGRVGLNQNVGGTTANMTFSANETDGTQIAVGVLADQEVEFVNGKEQEVKIGIKAHEGNCYRWIGINKIKLFKVQAKSYEVNEGVDYDNTQAGAGDVELTRTIKEGFNTLVLPFSMTQAEVEANFGAGAVVYTVSSYANDNVTFNVKEGISANEPVILKATQAGTNYTIEGRTIVAGAPVKNGTNVTMTGSYAASTTVPTDAYVINGGKFYLVNSAVTIKGTRAYINVTEPAGGEVKAVLNAVFEDGTETAIENVLGNEAANGAIYNLAGQRVQKAVKGLYIIGGKKVMVK